MCPRARVGDSDVICAARRSSPRCLTPEQWGAYQCDASQDALRVEVTPIAHAPTEQLDIALADGALRLRWAELEVSVRVAAP
ncbi:MAG: DUF2911 domain-containing protein [Myxococcota bacterium]|nr:DUF2911 domain-containing protein [Myxococcota bacterium]